MIDPATPITWDYLVKALESDNVGEPRLASDIKKRLHQQEDKNG